MPGRRSTCRGHVHGGFQASHFNTHLAARGRALRPAACHCRCRIAAGSQPYLYTRPAAGPPLHVMGSAMVAVACKGK